MNPTTKKLVSLFVSLILMFPAYILLHEGGHALAAVSCSTFSRVPLTRPANQNRSLAVPI